MRNLVEYGFFNFFISLTVILFSGNIIALLTNNKFTDSFFLIQVLFIVTFIQCYQLLYGQILVAEKKTKFISFSYIIIITISFFLTFFFVNILIGFLFYCFL